VPADPYEPSWVRWRLRLYDSNQFLAGFLGGIDRLELCRRNVAEILVEALGVVPVHPANGGQFHVFDGPCPGPRINSLL
jgi:hypothetical protein